MKKDAEQEQTCMKSTWRQSTSEECKSVCKVSSMLYGWYCVTSLPNIISFNPWPTLTLIKLLSFPHINQQSATDPLAPIKVNLWVKLCSTITCGNPETRLCSAGHISSTFWKRERDSLSLLNVRPALSVGKYLVAHLTPVTPPADEVTVLTSDPPPPGHSRCSSVVRRLFFRRSTSFFRKRMWRIMFSGESISMETSRGEGGADTGWSSFSWRILVRTNTNQRAESNCVPTDVCATICAIVALIN